MAMSSASWIAIFFAASIPIIFRKARKRRKEK